MRIRFFHTESFRLTAIYVAIFAISVAALGASVLSITNAAMRDQIVQFSRADIGSIRDGYVHEGLHEAREVTLQRMAATGRADFLVLQQDAKRLAGNLPPMPPIPGLQELPNPNASGHVILGTGELLAPGLYVFSGSDLGYVEAVRTRILGTLLWLFAAALLLATIGGILVSRSFLARADAIARTCRAIMAGNLKDRIPVRGSQDELDRLSMTINEMLARNATLMESLQQVTSDIAHDLRTPLTHLRNSLERPPGDTRAPQDYAAAIDAAAAATDDILALFAAILRIAQIDAGARRAGFAATDLTALLRKIQGIYGVVAEDAGHSLTIRADDACSISGDHELLFQMLANLVENAIVHTPAGTRITIDLDDGPGAVTIRVCDNGPGVPPSEHSKLFRRFYRLEASRSKPGHGLGLALVAAVADLHGGSVTMETPAAATGLAVRVTLPHHAG